MSGRRCSQASLPIAQSCPPALLRWAGPDSSMQCQGSELAHGHIPVPPALEWSGHLGASIPMSLPLFWEQELSQQSPQCLGGSLGHFQDPPLFLQVRPVFLSTSMCPMAQWMRCCPTCPAEPRRTGASCRERTRSGIYSGGSSSDDSLRAPSSAPTPDPPQTRRIQLQCLAQLVPGDGALVPLCVTTNPLTSLLLFFPPEAFAWGGNVLLLLFEPYPPLGGHYCRAAPAGSAPRDIPLLSQH